MQGIYGGGDTTITSTLSLSNSGDLKWVLFDEESGGGSGSDPGNPNPEVFMIFNGVLTKYNGPGGIVTIPDSVTSIGQSAFYGCTNLTSVTIPDSVTSIGNWAFTNCTGLASVTIGTSVTSIGNTAFDGCTSLAAINVGALNTAYSSQDGVLYNKDKTTLYTYPSEKTAPSFTIPNSVTSIESKAFSNCTSLTSVIIPENVTSILDRAFRDCTRLTSVTFQGTIASDNFDYNAFLGGDLRNKFYATVVNNGTPGTYTTTAPVGRNSVWTKLADG